MPSFYAITRNKNKKSRRGKKMPCIANADERHNSIQSCSDPIERADEEACACVCVCVVQSGPSRHHSQTGQFKVIHAHYVEFRGLRALRGSSPFIGCFIVESPQREKTWSEGNIGRKNQKQHSKRKQHITQKHSLFPWREQGTLTEVNMRENVSFFWFFHVFVEHVTDTVWIIYSA